MKFLNRKNYVAPSALTQKRKHNTDWSNWVCTHPTEYQEIVETLEEMQGGECAYCGQKLEETQRHIEHFYPRRQFNDKTFEWSNLFLCCSNKGNKYCEGFKDRSDNQYRNLSIIKPDIQNPQEYLTFQAELVKIKKNCPDPTLAKNTINRLGLNHPTLRQKRRVALQYLNTLLTRYYEELLIDSNRTLEEEEIERIRSEVISFYGYTAMIDDHIDSWMLSSVR